MAAAPSLPQLGDDVFLTDGGIETDLIFHRGVELPEFASFVLHDDPAGEAIAREYFLDYLRIGTTYGYGLVIETLTWRASADWGAQLGYDEARLRAANERAVEFLRDLRDQDAGSPLVVSGCIGPRGDAYSDLGSGDLDAAERYHRLQVEVLAGAGVDLVSALTLTNTAEAIGIAARGEGGRRSGRHLVHGRDRRCAADRHDAVRGDRRGRRGHRLGARVLHDQLCAPGSLRRHAVDARSEPGPPPRRARRTRRG